MGPPITIPNRIAGVKHVLGLSVRAGGTASVLRDAWNVLLSSTNPREMRIPMTSAGHDQHWGLILEARLAQEVVDLIPITMDHESKADEDLSSDAVRAGIRTLGCCYTYGGDCLKNSQRSSQHPATLILINFLLKESPTLLANWWERYRSRATNWLTAGRFPYFALPPVMFLCEMLSLRHPEINNPLEDRAMAQTLLQHRSLQDLLLSFTVFGYTDKGPNYDPIRFAMATVMIGPPFSCDHFSGFHALNQLQRRGFGDSIRAELIKPATFFLVCHSKLLSPSSRLRKISTKFIKWTLPCPHITWKKDLPLVLSSMIWREYLAEKGERPAERDVRLSDALLVIDALAAGDPDLMKQLLTKHDYLSLIGKLLTCAIMTLDRRYATNPQTLDIWKRLRESLLVVPDVLKIQLRKEYLHVLTCIRHMVKASSQSELSLHILNWWKDLAAAVGIYENDLLDEADAQRIGAMGDASPGCSCAPDVTSRNIAESYVRDALEVIALIPLTIDDESRVDEETSANTVRELQHLEALALLSFLMDEIPSLIANWWRGIG
ncbi:hypothetical protein FRB96_001301 [Tulasnella sp. 330]|nr:hypothetical protein FRB96_001301 [Tulasnella sp. 330]